MSTRFLPIALLVAAFAFACGKKEEPAAPAPAPTAEKKEGTTAAPAEKKEAPAAAPAAGDPAAEAMTIFKTRCAACHGEDGSGNGPAAANLPVKPRNYSDKEWQAGVDDEKLKKTIVEGGQSVGLSPLMTANPDLKDKPQVVAEIVKIIRGFAK